MKDMSQWVDRPEILMVKHVQLGARYERVYIDFGRKL